MVFLPANRSFPFSFRNVQVARYRCRPQAVLLIIIDHLGILEVAAIVVSAALIGPSATQYGEVFGSFGDAMCLSRRRFFGSFGGGFLLPRFTKEYSVGKDGQNQSMGAPVPRESWQRRQ
jgi:hypothetical protein